MVRLKEIQLSTLQGYNRISIPYGAIKRSNTDTYPIPDYIFQFLMVRLKEPFTNG